MICSFLSFCPHDGGSGILKTFTQISGRLPAGACEKTAMVGVAVLVMEIDST
jgi:formate dehydrogenase assembly factor FdhD